MIRYLFQIFIVVALVQSSTAIRLRHGSPAHKKQDVALVQVEEQASSMATGMHHAFMDALGAGDAESMNTIIKLVDETLLPELTKTVKNTQDNLDALFALMKKCDADDDVCDTKVRELKAAADSAATAAKTAADIATRDSTFTPTCPVVKFEGDGTTAQTAALTAYTTALKNAIDTYTTSSTAATGKASVATAKQNEFETKKGECHGQCKDCSENSVKNYQTAEDNAKKMLPGQKLDYQTYQLLKCIATESKGDNNADTIKKCRDEPADASSIKYTFYEIPKINCYDALTVYEEDGAKSDGWSNTKIATYGEATMHGPWGNDVRDVSQTFTVADSVKFCEVSWRSWAGYTRDWEYDYVTINDKTVWLNKAMHSGCKLPWVRWTPNFAMATDAHPVCYADVNRIVDCAGGNLKLRFVSQIDQAIGDEWWAFSNVKVIPAGDPGLNEVVPVSAGWSAPELSEINAAGDKVHGIWGNENKESEKTFTVPEGTNYVTIEFRSWGYYSRDNEYNYLVVDDIDQWAVRCSQATWTNFGNFYAHNLAALYYKDGKLSVPLSKKGQVKLKFVSVIDEGLDNEGWGFSNVKITPFACPSGQQLVDGKCAVPPWGTEYELLLDAGGEGGGTSYYCQQFQVWPDITVSGSTPIEWRNNVKTCIDYVASKAECVTKDYVVIHAYAANKCGCITNAAYAHCPLTHNDGAGKIYTFRKVKTLA